ncbi:MAG: glutamine amidotransferase-related protein [Promethearchaeota archaeon]
MTTHLAVIVNFDKEIQKFKDRFTHTFSKVKHTFNWTFIHYSTISDPEIAKIIQNSDGILLTGSYNMLSDASVQQKYSPVMELIQTYKKPILGICYGLQQIAVAWGFTIQPISHPEHDIENEKTLNLQFIRPFPLFPSPSITVYETHHQEIAYEEEFDNIFTIYASSPATKIQAIKHNQKPIYGVQFHPENPTNPTALRDGILLIEQFIGLIIQGQNSN